MPRLRSRLATAAALGVAAFGGGAIAAVVIANAATFATATPLAA
jgi:hypothetical protein